MTTEDIGLSYVSVIEAIRPSQMYASICYNTRPSALINSLKPSDNSVQHLLRRLENRNFLTRCFCVFRTILTVSSDYCPKQR
jgi:hypothetical protein